MRPYLLSVASTFLFASLALVACSGKRGGDGAACQSSSQCQQSAGEACIPGGILKGGPSICDVAPPRCSADSECADAGAGYVCDLLSCGGASGSGGTAQPGVCVPACAQSLDCAGDGTCKAGHCITQPCTQNSDCDPDFTCDPSSHTCEWKSCQSDSECTGFCIDNTCSPEPGVCLPEVT